MAKFKIEWKDGEVEEVNQADCETVEQFTACRFGDSVPGGTVTLVDETEKPVKKSKKAAE